MAASLGLLADRVVAQQKPAEPVAGSNVTNVVPLVPPKPKSRSTYRPPLRGKPDRRIVGGSRGAGVSLISLLVLTPDHVGLTTKEQPSLFWYQSEPADVSFEITVVTASEVDPLLEFDRGKKADAGIQRARLSEHAARLAIGADYQWHVALVVNPEGRSEDVIASGYIQRVEPSAELVERLRRAHKLEVPSIYAEYGYWYDALEALSDLIDEQPGNTALRVERADLLRQVGLTNAVNYETKMAVEK